jgi:uncharacterized protein DUF3800
MYLKMYPESLCFAVGQNVARRVAYNRCVYLAYIDDSGNSGPPPGGTLSYALGCVLLEAKSWPAMFDDLIGFRRFLQKTFGVPVRTEIKANYLLGNRGPHFSKHPLSEAARFRIYRGLMHLPQKLGANVFGVVVKKDVLQQRGVATDPREIAWDWMLQRLERTSTKSTTPLLIVHDEGDVLLIRKATRKARRAGTAGSAFGMGVLQVPARYIVDDPVPRQSTQSYFIQLADLAAYAAFRYVYPPGPRIASVVPKTMWDELGPAKYLPVSAFSGGPAGLVIGPK